MFKPILTHITCFTFLAAIAFCIILWFFGPPSIASRWAFTLNHQKPPFFGGGFDTEPGPRPSGFPPSAVPGLFVQSLDRFFCLHLAARPVAQPVLLGWVTFLGYHGIPHSNHEKIMANPYPLQRYEYLGSNAWGCGCRS